MKSVLVVGGGVVGLFTAYYAMLRGYGVTVVERGGPGHDCCSLGNAGLIVPSHFVPLAAPGMIAMGVRMLADPEGPFAIRPRCDRGLIDWCIKFARSCTEAHVTRSAPLLRDLNLQSRGCYEELGSRPRQDFGLTRHGLLMLCRLPETLRAEAVFVERARRLGMAAELLTPERAEKLDPAIRMNIAGAVYFPDDWSLTPARLIAGLTRELELGGVKFLWNTEAVRAVARGRVVEYIDTSAGRLSADETVIAGGAWSSGLAGSLGLHLPLQAGKGYSLTLTNPCRVPNLCSLLTEARVAVTPMEGSLRFAGTMEIVGLDPSVNQRRVRGIVKSVPRYFPQLTSDDFSGVPVWSGLRPCSPDGLPYIGRFHRYSNLSVATGHAMMGVSMGPITGKLMAEVLSDETPSIDITLLDPDRYASVSA